MLLSVRMHTVYCLQLLLFQQYVRVLGVRECVWARATAAASAAAAQNQQWQRGTAAAAAAIMAVAATA